MMSQAQGGNVTAGAGGRDRAADTGGGSFGSTFHAARTDYSVSSECTGQGRSVRQARLLPSSGCSHAISLRGIKLLNNP